MKSITKIELPSHKNDKDFFFLSIKKKEKKKKKKEHDQILSKTILCINIVYNTSDQTANLNFRWTRGKAHSNKLIRVLTKKKINK